jgi:hypothetical protein
MIDDEDHERDGRRCYPDLHFHRQNLLQVRPALSTNAEAG